MKDRIRTYLDYLYKLERLVTKYDLSNITAILNYLDNPQNNFKSIHIAGTNGKGGTASFLNSNFIESGYKTGLFTSPHILNFNERIRVNGKCIPNKYIINFVSKNKKMFDDIKPSFFEVNTALAFQYFADNNCDIAVIESGLGGRLDSTNILKPELSIITSIGLDHTEYLGNTLLKIAIEKAGIIKPGVPVIISDEHKSLRKVFNKKSKKIYYFDDLLNFEITGNTINKQEFIIKPKIKDKIIPQQSKFSIPLSGKYQVRNAVTSALAYSVYSKSSINQNIIQKGFNKVIRNSGYRGRMQVINKRSHIFIFDVSHNNNAIINFMKEIYTLLNTICEEESDREAVIIFALMKEKDYKSISRTLIKSGLNIIITKVSYERSLEPVVIYNYMKSLKSKQKIIKTNSVKEALNKAERNKTIIFTGSFFLVSDAVKALKLEKEFKC